MTENATTPKIVITNPHVGGNIIAVADGDFITHNYLGTDPPLPIQTLADPLSEDGQPIFVCRRGQVAELNGYLQAACYDRSPQTKQLVVVTGNYGAGKRDLLRTWLNDARRQANAPNIAIAPFLPPTIPDEAQAEFYQTHPAWQLDWSRYGGHIARHFPPLFTLGSYPWVVLAAQLAGKSERVRSLLSGPGSLPGLPSLQSEQPIDSGALLRSLTALLRAAASERPLVIVLEHVQHAGLAWLLWLKLWLQDMANLPILFLAVVDTPFPLHDERLQVTQKPWLEWLQEQTVAYSPRAHLLHAGHLLRGEFEELLAPSADQWALDLYYLSEGSPVILRELLAYWRNEGKAVQGQDGRWHLHFDPQREAPGSLTMALVEGPLRACAHRAQDLGFDLSHDHLREWLKLAAWEGDVFTDEALAHALGLHDDGQLEDFQSVLDDGLCRDYDGNGILEELEEPVKLATHDLDKPFRYMARYRIVPPVLGRILLNNQQDNDRRADGQRYAQALAAAYAPFVERMAPKLIEIYETTGELEAAQILRARFIAPRVTDPAVWSTLQMLASTDDSKRRLLRQILDDYKQAHLWRHPSLFLMPLQIALTIARELHDLSTDALILTNIGMVYSALGDKQRALQCYEKALPLTRQIGDKGNEAATLVNIGMVYFNLGDQQHALDYYGQALPLLRKVGDKSGEAVTLNNIGGIYSAISDRQQALRYLEQALPLRRQVGDKAGEARTLINIGTVYSALGDPQQALDYYEQALPLTRQMSDKDDEAATLNNIGAIYSALGDQQRALHCYEQALPLTQQIGDKSGEARTLNNIGGVYSDLGDKQQAVDYYEQALPLLRHVGDKSGEATTLHNIGAVYSALGDKQQALGYFETALPLRRQVGDKDGEARTLISIAIVYSDLGVQQQALAYFEQGLAVAPSIR